MRIRAQAPNQPAGKAQRIEQTVQKSQELQYPDEILCPKCMNEYQSTWASNNCIIFGQVCD